MPDEFDIGFLGGGQLARMSIQAAQRMGLRCVSLDPSECSPASQIASSIVGRLDDPKAVAQVVLASKRVTLENEFIPSQTIDAAYALSGKTPSNETPRPSWATLARIQDKLAQRKILAEAEVPAPLAMEMASAEEAIERIGFPMVLKARFGGYDGKGTLYAKTRKELEAHRARWAGGGWLAETFVPFKRELAAMVARSPETTFAFPTMETVQTHHVCDLVFPSGADASKIAIAAVEAMEGYGLFGVELFQLDSGEFLVNELAPRPHNSGHYTLDWEALSQFEAHVRIAMGYPIQAVESQTKVVMANLLGQEGAGDYREGVRAALRGEGVHAHWYGKAEAKPGRKMGHLNVVGRPGEATDSILERAKRARADFYRAWTGS